MIDFFANPLAAYGLLSAALSTVAYLPYIRDTLLRRTQPQRASWLIWSALSSIALVSQIHEGASDSLWFAGAQVSGTVTIFILSIWFGMGGFLNRQDFFVLILAAAGLLAWYLTDSAAYALAMTITISLLGGMVTIRKAYQNPDSETISTWVCSFAASLLAILAVGKLDWVLLAYPLYLLALNWAIVAAILFGRVAQSQRAGTMFAE